MRRCVRQSCDRLHVHVGLVLDPKVPVRVLNVTIDWTVLVEGFLGPTLLLREAVFCGTATSHSRDVTATVLVLDMRTQAEAFHSLNRNGRLVEHCFGKLDRPALILTLGMPHAGCSHRNCDIAC